MRCSNRLVDKRIIAFVMLFAWVFSLGAGFANACLLDGLNSAALDHQGRWASTSVAPEVFAPDGDGDAHTRSHLVHCQPLQAMELATPSRPAAEKTPDLDTIVATIGYGARPVRATDSRYSVRSRSDPVVAEPPLFIRFRRLIP